MRLLTISMLPFIELAVAGSGILAANSVSLDSVGPQIKLLKKMRSSVPANS